ATVTGTARTAVTFLRRPHPSMFHHRCRGSDSSLMNYSSPSTPLTPGRRTPASVSLEGEGSYRWIRSNRAFLGEGTISGHTGNMEDDLFHTPVGPLAPCAAATDTSGRKKCTHR